MDKESKQDAIVSGQQCNKCGLVRSWDNTKCLCSREEGNNEWIEIKDQIGLSDVPRNKFVVFYMGDNDYALCTYSVDEWVFWADNERFNYRATHFFVLTPPKEKEANNG